jgi:hypothetical protein
MPQNGSTNSGLKHNKKQDVSSITLLRGGGEEEEEKEDS